MNNTKTTIQTTEDVDTLIAEFETYVDDLRMVRSWMEIRKRKAIEVRFWASIERGRSAFNTGLRGLIEARR